MTPSMHPLPALSAVSVPLPLATLAATILFGLPLVLLALWTARACRGGERAWFEFVVRSHLFLSLVMFAEAPAFLSLRLDRLFVHSSGPSAVMMAWWPALASTNNAIISAPVPTCDITR